MENNQEKLIKQEQEILDDLIRRMDNALMQIDKNLKAYDLQIRKANAACLPDAYGALVSAQKSKAEGKERRKVLGISRDELYKTRIEVRYTDKRGTGRDDIKIGLHSFIYGADVFIMSWVLPISRHYLLDNADSEFDNETKDKNGIVYHTHYELLKKRDVKLDFDRVREVIQKFPIYDEDDEQIVADEFLKELLRRRSEREFQNIVFSIQKQQSEIIQAPFRQYMIVQGCAGSGKSMIMLHRLPIIIYDNPKSLSRSNIYVITPSMAYIQMAHNMMMELEIEDLMMGTLNQYYDHVLALYGVPQKAYGNIRADVALKEDDIQYVYSQKFLIEICKQIEEIINVYTPSYFKWYGILGLGEPDIKSKGTYQEYIRSLIIAGQMILNRQLELQKQFHKLLKAVIAQFSELANLLAGYKSAIIKRINTKITDKQNELGFQSQEIERVDKNRNPIGYENRMKKINGLVDQIKTLREELTAVEADEEYFNALQSFAEEKIKGTLQQFSGYDTNFEKIADGNVYMLYVLKRHLCDFYDEIRPELSSSANVYEDSSKKIESFLRKMDASVKALSEYNETWLRYDEIRYIREVLAYYRSIGDTLVKTVYSQQMERLGNGYEFKDKNLALPCSPYMYLQILFHYQGTHDKRKETLITIDEAQNLMPYELKMIRELNSNRVVLNLFGDIKQHIEGSKGIDSWDEFADVAKFTKYEMRENYRNARQVTNYCNKKFGLNMRAINLDGKGVHVIAEQALFERCLRQLFMKPQSPGLSCIIVKNSDEGKIILDLLRENLGRIQNIVLEPQEIHPNRWNLMSIDQVKGLEFETVVVVSGRMSKNEKYIAYTRALDELYIYDSEISLDIQKQQADEGKDDLSVDCFGEKTSKVRRKRVKHSSADLMPQDSKKGQKKKDTIHNGDGKASKLDLKEFCELSGFEVIDLRRKKGVLWVVGEREELEEFVDQVTDQYGVSGKFMKDKSTGFRMGWCVKMTSEK